MITNIRGMDPSYTMAYDHPIHIMNRKSMYDTNHQMIGTPTKNRGMNLSIENPGPNSKKKKKKQRRLFLCALPRL